MRRRSLALAGVLLMTITACGGSDTPKTAAPAPTTRAPLGTLAPTTASSTSAATTTTTIAATTTAAPTTTAASTIAPAAGATTTLPDCRTSPGVACQVTVPLRADINDIVDAYRRFAEKDLEVKQDPDGADWDGYLSMIHPDSRAAARAEVQARFDRGQVLNVSLGVTLRPHSSRTQQPGDYEILEDCRSDGSYWADRVSGEPASGEVAEVRPVVYVVDMKKLNGQWLVVGFQRESASCASPV